MSISIDEPPIAVSPTLNKEQNNEIELFASFLRSLPDDTNWKNLSDLAKALIKKEMVSRNHSKLNISDAYLTSIVNQFKSKREKTENINLNIQDYLTVTWTKEDDQSFFRTPKTNVYYGPINRNKFLNDWFDYSSSADLRKGVYLIGDFYIGQSTNIRERLLNHVSQTINSTAYDNKNLYNKILENLKNGHVMPVTLVSDDIYHEQFFIDFFRYQIGLPLVNSKNGLGGNYV